MLVAASVDSWVTLALDVGNAQPGTGTAATGRLEAGTTGTGTAGASRSGPGTAATAGAAVLLLLLVDDLVLAGHY